MNQELSFFQWIDKTFEEEWPDNICFNLYEGEDPYRFHVQIIGSFSYDVDGEWVCNDDKSTEENVFYFCENDAGKTWEEGLEHIQSEVKRYLKAGRFLQLLKNKNVVAIGFVDGDLEIVHQK